MDPVTAELVAAIVPIARRAADAIMDVYAGEFTATAKADASPVTAADLRAHQIIQFGLEQLVPRLPILSEEAAPLDAATRLQWSRYWLVDPLDGTREFLSRNGEFTVNIALIERHRPILGVVLLPAAGVVYWGAQGLGAQRIDASGASQPIHAACSAASPPRVVGSRSHRGGELDRYLARLGPHEWLAAGSALKFCLLAEGSADLYPRLSPTSEWDTAAGQAVAEAAGALVVDLQGQPLRYNTGPGLLNPSFVAYADRSRDWLAAL
jgi:3'(2'), 5'-bisphosphate nucleotidase